MRTRQSDAQPLPPGQQAGPGGRNGSARRRVRFAQGPLADKYRTDDGHPDREGQVARAKRSLGMSWGHDLTPSSIMELEQELGEECRPSLDRLKRRVGLLPLRKRPKQFLSWMPDSSSSGSEDEGGGGAGGRRGDRPAARRKNAPTGKPGRKQVHQLEEEEEDEGSELSEPSASGRGSGAVAGVSKKRGRPPAGPWAADLGTAAGTSAGAAAAAAAGLGAARGRKVRQKAGEQPLGLLVPPTLRMRSGLLGLAEQLGRPAASLLGPADNGVMGQLSPSPGFGGVQTGRKAPGRENGAAPSPASAGAAYPGYSESWSSESPSLGGSSGGALEGPLAHPHRPGLVHSRKAALANGSAGAGAALGAPVADAAGGTGQAQKRSSRRLGGLGDPVATRRGSLRHGSSATVQQQQQ